MVAELESDLKECLEEEYVSFTMTLERHLLHIGPSDYLNVIKVSDSAVNIDNDPNKSLRSLNRAKRRSSKRQNARKQKSLKPASRPLESRRSVSRRSRRSRRRQSA